jgi:uncharacterized protein
MTIPSIYYTNATLRIAAARARGARANIDFKMQLLICTQSWPTSAPAFLDHPLKRGDSAMAMSFYDACVPALINTLTDMKAWLDKAAERESDLLDARLIEDMRPLTAQYQMVSDTAKNGVARLTGLDIPAMPDTETSFAELKARCDKTIAFVQSVPRAAFEGAETREVTMKFPNDMGYRWDGLSYLTGFMLPNFYFHATTAYAILRANGVAVGKPDFLAHLGAPINMATEPA